MRNVQKDVWDSVARSVNFTLNIDYQEFLNHVPLNSTILDFGCGYGRVTNELFNLGYERVVGIDTSFEMIARGKDNYPHLTLNHYEPPLIPAEDGQYDAIMCCAVLTCLPNKRTQNLAISELSRILKKSGIIYFAEFLQTKNRTYGEGGTFKTSFGVQMKHFRPQELLDLITQFKTISVKDNFEKSISGNDAASLQIIVKKEK